MLPIRIKACSESDLRMLGDLAHNIQRVLPVTQADIDAAAALGKEWVVWKVIEVSDPLDNLRGGTQLVIKQNSILPGQNVRRVLIVSGPSGQKVIVGPGISPLSLPDAIADSLSYVKAFGGTEQRNIPDGYIERQFIYMMDGSYLLTDIVPTYDGRVEMDFQTTTVPAGNQTFIGGRSSSGAGIGLLCAKIGSEIVFDAFGSGSGDRYSSGLAAQNNTRYKLTYNNQVATLESGGSTLFTQTFTGTNSNGAALAINATNSNGTITGNNAGIYLYSFKAWNAQGELVADYVPAVQRGTVPVVGFYDTVSKTFKTATAGTFAAGGEAVPTPDTPMDIVSNNGVLKARHQSGLPLGYTLLDYIESSGTQYIDTGIGLNSAYKYRLVVASVYANNASNIWGYKSNASYADGPCCIIGWTHSPTTYIGAYNKNGNITGSFPAIEELRWTAGTFFDILLDVTQSNFTVNDTNYYSTSGVSTVLTTDSWTDTHHPYLFGTQTVDSAVPSSAKRIKTYQVRDTNGDLIQNFVPAKNSSNVVGMYDTVSGQFFTNAGTGDFVAGDPVSDPVEIYTDGTVETINVHGKNLFDENAVDDNKSIIVENNQVSIISRTGWAVSDYIYTISGQKYIRSNNGTAVGDTVIYFNANKEFVTTASPGTGVPFEIPVGVSYIRFNINKTNTPLGTYQVEQGSTATAYVPYYDGGTATAEMLLKVGDYTDVQEVIAGDVTRKVGIKVLDGTENWMTGTGGVWYNFQGDVGAFNTTSLICSHYSYAGPQVNIVNMSQNQFSSYSNGNIAFKSAETTSADDFKVWLADQYAAGTPVIIVYPLATPTTESVTGQTLQVQAGDNTLEITQASLNNLQLECEYEKTV